MPRAIALRSDFTGQQLRGLARRSKDASQARRLMALAVISDGGTRSEAAQLGCVTLQIVRDWVLRFNAEGTPGLIDRRGKGRPPLLTAAHRVALAAVLNGTPLLPQSGQREFAAEVSWGLPSLAPGAASLIDVTVSGARAGDLASASLVSSTRFIELNAAVWSNNTVRVMARNISAATFDLAAATLSVGVVKRRAP